MAKAGAPKRAKPKPMMTDKKQSERFKEAARELGAEESGETFSRVIDRVLKPSTTRRDKSTRQ
jgi:hypothetical protein